MYQQLISETDVLPELLATARARCHVVVVDTPPGLGPITRKVLEASQHVIVPLQCEPLALQTTPQILRAIQDIASFNEQLTLDGILHDDVRPRKSRERASRRLREAAPAGEHRLPRRDTEDRCGGGCVCCRPAGGASEPCGPRFTGVCKPRNSDGGQARLKPSAVALLLSVAASAIVAAACVEIPTGSDTVLSIQLGPLPSPGVVVGDSLRDTLGVVRGIPFKAFNYSGQEVANVTARFSAVDRGIRVDSVSGVVRGRQCEGRCEDSRIGAGLQRISFDSHNASAGYRRWIECA